MNRSVVVKHIEPVDKRVICISDIHGDLDRYKALLEKVSYKPNADRLILLGDLIEKGPKNLETLRYIMNQVRDEDVHCLMGNCDFTLKNVLFSYRLAFLKRVVSSRPSTVKEMAAEIGCDLDMDTGELCMRLREHFLPELTFVSDLPHVLLDGNRIYTHAAIMNETTFGSDFRETMTTPFFMNTDQSFSKPVVCGHLPVSEYCRQILSLEPVFDPKRSIWSIDGGNIVKEWGQLNALVFDGNETYTVSYDDLPEATVKNTVHPGVQIPFCLTFNHGDVEVLDEGEKQSYVHSPYLGRDFWMDTEFIRGGRGCDYTNWQMPLEKGDVVKVVRVFADKVYIKKNGRLGWAYRNDINL